MDCKTFLELEGFVANYLFAFGAAVGFIPLVFFI
jgi:hypothetical protein